MADTATSSSGQRVVGINTLSIEELSALQRQLDGDLNFFNSSLSELKTVATKFGRCQATVESMNPDERDKEALIPLSESVYFLLFLKIGQKFEKVMALSCIIFYNAIKNCTYKMLKLFFHFFHF